MFEVAIFAALGWERRAAWREPKDAGKNRYVVFEETAG